MTTTTDVRSLAGAINAARPALDERDARLVGFLYEFLGRGEPVDIAQIAAVAGITAEEIGERLARFPGLFRDERDRVIGFWGLTVVEMPPHELLFNGRKLWAWCAWDTLFLPRRLEATLEVRSLCPVTKERISLRVSPEKVETVDPADTVVSFLEPDRPFGPDVIQSFCHYVHFLAGQPAAARWNGEHPGTFLLSLEDAFELGRLTDEVPSRRSRT